MKYTFSELFAPVFITLVGAFFGVMRFVYHDDALFILGPLLFLTGFAWLCERVRYINLEKKHQVLVDTIVNPANELQANG
jgi:hypothetical protein